jgi:Zn finger protein HypA/HybF involved in hydrogenase expression
MDAWYKAVGRGLIAATPQNKGGRNRYDWAAIQRFYDEGHTYRECRMRFGFHAKAWEGAVKRGDVRTRPRAWPIERLLADGRCRKTIKGRLVQVGLLENRCAQCGLREWRGKPLCVQLDHINGNSEDHRVENLRMLCPNCHSQTETYGAKNLRLKKLSPE